MEIPDLVQALKRVRRRLDQPSGPSGLILQDFDGPPFGAAYVSIAKGDDSPFPSSNRNRIYLSGAEGGLTKESVARFRDFYAEARVPRFFVWLSPGPEMMAVRDWLGEAGLTRFPYVAYPTLARGVEPPSPARTDFEVRELREGEAAGLTAALLGDAAWPEYLASAGAPGFHHFIAFDGPQPVASAVLRQEGDLGYLCIARTAEPGRNRGAQSALIARRIEKARALGCKTLASETLSILPASLRNLQKAGFAVAYEKEIYEGKLAG